LTLKRGEKAYMPKIRVKLLPPDAEHNGWHVHLPAYAMVAGSFQPIIAGKVHADGVFPNAVLTPAEEAQLTVEVEVPADECTAEGKLDKAKIRAKYRGQPKWDRLDVLSDV